MNQKLIPVNEFNIFSQITTEALLIGSIALKMAAPMVTKQIKHNNEEY